MKKIKFLCSLLPLFLLTGCFDSRDVKNVAIVMGMGVDLSDDNKYKTVTQVIIPKGLSKEGGGDTFENFEGKGNHLGECIENTTLKCGKYMYLSHATALIVSEKVAREGIYEILDFFMRDNELRSNLLLAVSESGVEEIMKDEGELVKVPLSSVATLGRRLGETSLGQVPNIFGFVSDMIKKNSATLVPVINADKKESTVSGSAIFKKGKMVGKISNTEARGVLWLMNKIENAIMTIDYDGNSFDIKVKKAKSEIQPIYNEGIFINANVKCSISLLRDNNGVVNVYGIKKVSEKINETIKSEITAALDVMKKYNCDVYGFENIVYKDNPEKWKSIDKETFFRDVTVNIDVKTEVEEVGSILKSAEKEQDGVL